MRACCIELVISEFLERDNRIFREIGYYHLSMTIPSMLRRGGSRPSGTGKALSHSPTIRAKEISLFFSGNIYLIIICWRVRG